MHVAMTGLRAFWPDDRKFWLVAPGCVPNPFTADSASPEPEGTMPYPWPVASLDPLHDDLEVTRRRLLLHCADALNALHGIDRSRRYWELFVGPWLFYYTNLIAHHVHSLEQARARFGDIETIGLDAAHFTPRSITAFLHSVSDDLYNLQAYTRIAGILGVRLTERRAGLTTDRLADHENPENLHREHLPRLRRWRLAAAYEAFAHAQRLLSRRARVLLRRAYFPRHFERRLALATGARIWPFIANGFSAPLQRSDTARRERLRGFTPCNVLECVLAELVPADMPQTFVESYDALVQFAEWEYRGIRPDAVMSTISWHAEEPFGHFAGRAAESGASMIGGQHGGNWGVEANFQVERFERGLVDRYLTWGWTDANDPRIMPTPATRLVATNKRPQSDRGEGVLYVGTVALRFPSVARGDFSGYFDLQRRFFASLSDQERERIRVRLHTSDFGWHVEQRLVSSVPGLRIERWDVPFTDSLLSARIYVADHISTSYAEALARDIPTVIFWDHEFLGVRDSARRLFDRGREVGIIHDTPESAARWISRVYDDVDSWWRSPECVGVADAMRDQFARTTDDPLREWNRVFEQLSPA